MLRHVYWFSRRRSVKHAHCLYFGVGVAMCIRKYLGLSSFISAHTCSILTVYFQFYPRGKLSQMFPGCLWAARCNKVYFLLHSLLERSSFSHYSQLIWKYHTAREQKVNTPLSLGYIGAFFAGKLSKNGLRKVLGRLCTSADCIHTDYVLVFTWKWSMGFCMIFFLSQNSSRPRLLCSLDFFRSLICVLYLIVVYFTRKLLHSVTQILLHWLSQLIYGFCSNCVCLEIS